MKESLTKIGKVSSPAEQSLITWLPVAIMAIAGMTQLVPAIRFALKDHTSDVLRQWRVSRYVQSRVNPYPVALAALDMAAKTGQLESIVDLGIHSVVPLAPGHKRPPHAGAMPKHGPHPDTRKDVGPPEATYPPTSMMVLAFTIGYLRPDWLLPLWAFLNLVLLVLIAYELTQLQCLTNAKIWSVACFISLALLWPPIPYFFSRGQFSFIVLWCVLVAGRLGKNRDWLAGILYSLALIKPSLALPFLLLPLVQRRWKVLAWTAGVQAGLLLFASWLLRASPIALTTEWLSVGRYFMQGMYTLQEIIDDFNLDGTVWSFLLPLIVVAASTVLIYRADRIKAIALLSIVAAIWTYHYRYDFVVLLCAVAFLSVPLIRPLRWDIWQWSGLLAFVFLGLALTDVALEGNTVAWRIVRWAGRLSLIWIIIAVARRRSPIAPDKAVAPLDQLASAPTGP